jgi:hypothetical protein
LFGDENMGIFTILGFWLIALRYLANSSCNSWVKNQPGIRVIKVLSGALVILGWILVLVIPLGSVSEQFRRIGLDSTSSSTTAIIAGAVCAIILWALYKIGVYIIKTIWQSPWQESVKGVALLVLLIIPAAGLLINGVAAFAMYVEIGDNYQFRDGIFGLFPAYFALAMMAGLLLLPIVAAGIICRIDRHSKENESSSKIRTTSSNTIADKASDLLNRVKMDISQVLENAKSTKQTSGWASGKTRFSRSAGGVITDSKTNLQWLPGPDEDTDYQRAEEWVASQTMAGGGWRMPTRQELKTLYDRSCEFHIPSPFKATDMRWIWAEPHDATTAWDFNFEDGGENVDDRDISGDVRVFAVRSSTRSDSTREKNQTTTEPTSSPEVAAGRQFTKSIGGVITDSKTNLQWLPGKDKNTSYVEAERWVVSRTTAGGGWRMPTRLELQTLHDPSCEFHISPLFKATGMYWVWAEPHDSSSAWIFRFRDGADTWNARDNSNFSRVFAVRARR